MKTATRFTPEGDPVTEKRSESKAASDVVHVDSEVSELTAADESSGGSEPSMLEKDEEPEVARSTTVVIDPETSERMYHPVIVQAYGTVTYTYGSDDVMTLLPSPRLTVKPTVSVIEDAILLLSWVWIAEVTPLR